VRLDDRHREAWRRCALNAVLLTMVAGCAPTATSTIEAHPTSISTTTVVPNVSAPTEPVPTGESEAIERAPVLPAAEAEPARADPFEMTFVGDVMLGRYRKHGFDPIIEDGEDGFEVFSGVTELLRSHLTIGNLETPLVRELPDKSPIVSSARFGAPAALASALGRAGFHAMSVANNHAYDLRRAGLVETPEILAELGIVALGSVREAGPALRVQTIEREGLRVGVLAVATRLNGPKPRGLPSIPWVPTLELDDQVVPLVKQARTSHDVIVVLVHWGEEYRDTPTSAQRSVAHDLVDGGVDLVVGHHPHVLQGIEHYRDGVIAYSLGNFLFDRFEGVLGQTGVLRVRVRDGGCLDATVFHPVIIEGSPAVHPVPATGEQGEEINDRVRRLSERWGTRWVEQGGALVLDMPACTA